MFVALPTRERVLFRWATPLLFTLLWGSFIAATLLPDAEQHRLVLGWGVLTGSPDSLLETCAA